HFRAGSGISQRVTGIDARQIPGGSGVNAMFLGRDGAPEGGYASVPDSGDALPALIEGGQSVGGQNSSSGSIRLARFRSFPERYEQWRQRLSVRLDSLDIAPDLAQDIGSRRWFRGAGTMGALAFAALAFWPDFAPVEAAAPMRIDDSVRDEFRSQMILPLALGGDTGRRMGPTASVVPLASAPERPQLHMVATLAQGDGFAS